MSTVELLKVNILSPFVLAFVLGVVAKVVRSDLALPKDIYSGLSIFLLLAIGLKGGVELSASPFHQIIFPVLVTLLIGVLTPISAFLAFRKLGRFSGVDAAAIAAHYGSVSAVTFIASTQFVSSMGFESEGFLPTLLTLLEGPGILIALAIGAMYRAPRGPESEASLSFNKTPSVLHEIFTSRSMVLLIGGLIVGCLIGKSGFAPVKGFFEGGFKGALVLFLLELGVVAGERLKDVPRVGLRLSVLGVTVPLVHGAVGVLIACWAGLSVGGATVFGAMAASASYIAAPPAVRMTLPEANPAYYLTASLVITFPFNLLIGIPFYFAVAKWLAGG